jgi:hypothetical protein
LQYFCPYFNVILIFGFLGPDRFSFEGLESDDCLEFFSSLLVIIICPTVLVDESAGWHDGQQHDLAQSTDIVRQQFDQSLRVISAQSGLSGRGHDRLPVTTQSAMVWSLLSAVMWQRANPA